MSDIPRVILHVSPILYGRMQLRAAEQQHGVDEWVLRTVIGELLRLENEEVQCAHEVLAARSLPPVVPPANERNARHAAHP